MKIIQAQSEHLDIVRDLFREYQSWLNADCCFQGFEEELASLPGRYAEPKGIIYLALDKGQAVGCSAIRPREDKPKSEVELKRLFVKDVFRGHGIGKKLFNQSMQGAKEIGYDAVVLETLPIMEAAQSLYRDYGFEPMPNYSEDNNNDSGVECYRYDFKH